MINFYPSKFFLIFCWFFFPNNLSVLGAYPENFRASISANAVFNTDTNACLESMR